MLAMGGEVDLHLLHLPRRTFIALFAHFAAHLQLLQEQNPGHLSWLLCNISDFNYLSILKDLKYQHSIPPTHHCPTSIWPGMLLHLQPAWHFLLPDRSAWEGAHTALETILQPGENHQSPGEVHPARLGRRHRGRGCSRSPCTGVRQRKGAQAVLGSSSVPTPLLLHHQPGKAAAALPGLCWRRRRR